ncbi:unnamed protein product [Amoebophrya sp. A120]|nr:unnamed protein product [Amoebophrya sp. A120]|eukprot:GSA120T00014387001.1
MSEKVFLLDASLWGGKSFMVKEYFQKYSRLLERGGPQNDHNPEEMNSRHPMSQLKNSIVEPDENIAAEMEKMRAQPVTFLVPELTEDLALHLLEHFANEHLILTFKPVEQKNYREEPASLVDTGEDKSRGVSKQDQEQAEVDAANGENNDLAVTDDLVTNRKNKSADEQEAVDNKWHYELMDMKLKNWVFFDHPADQQHAQEEQTMIGTLVNGMAENVPTPLAFVVLNKNFLPKNRQSLLKMIRYATLEQDNVQVVGTGFAKIGNVLNDWCYVLELKDWRMKFSPWYRESLLAVNTQLKQQLQMMGSLQNQRVDGDHAGAASSQSEMQQQLMQEFIQENILGTSIRGSWFEGVQDDQNNPDGTSTQNLQMISFPAKVCDTTSPSFLIRTEVLKRIPLDPSNIKHGDLLALEYFIRLKKQLPVPVKVASVVDAEMGYLVGEGKETAPGASEVLAERSELHQPVDESTVSKCTTCVDAETFIGDDGFSTSGTSATTNYTRRPASHPTSSATSKNSSPRMIITAASSRTSSSAMLYGSSIFLTDNPSKIKQLESLWRALAGKKFAAVTDLREVELPHFAQGEIGFGSLESRFQEQREMMLAEQERIKTPTSAAIPANNKIQTTQHHRSFHQVTTVLNFGCNLSIANCEIPLWVYRGWSAPPCCRRTLRRLLFYITDLFDKVGIRYFLTDGGLLGGLKYHSLIRWDADIDLQIHGEDFDKYLLGKAALQTGTSIGFPHDKSSNLTTASTTLEEQITKDGFFLRKHQTSKTQFLLQANVNNYLLIELNKRDYDQWFFNDDDDENVDAVDIKQGDVKTSEVVEKRTKLPVEGKLFDVVYKPAGRRTGRNTPTPTEKNDEQDHHLHETTTSSPEDARSATTSTSETTTLRGHPLRADTFTPLKAVRNWYGYGFLANRLRHVPEWEEAENPLFCATPYHHNCADLLASAAVPRVVF